MYAKVDPKLWPPGLEEVEYLNKRLKQINWDYEVLLERRMFAGLAEQPDIKFSIRKWKPRIDYNDAPVFEVVWEGEGLSECTGMLRMLIAVEESNAAGDDRVYPQRVRRIP